MHLSATLQAYNGWPKEVIQRYYTEILRMKPLPWATFVAPEFQAAQFHLPKNQQSVTEPAIPPAHQSSSCNVGQSYIVSQMDNLNLSSQVETLLEDGDSNEKLKKMDSVEGYFESLVEKRRALEHASETQEKLSERLEQHLQMVFEDKNCIYSQLAEVNQALLRTKSFLSFKAEQDAQNMHSLKEYMSTKKMSHGDILRILKDCQESSEPSNKRLKTQKTEAGETSDMD